MNFILLSTIIVTFAFGLIQAGQQMSLKEAIEKHQSADGCICISSNYGCHNLKTPKKLYHTGWCKKRCCTERKPNTKVDCRCMNTNTCPDDHPNEEGECLKMIECCPKMLKREL